MKNYDIIIIGSGFKAMITAYFALKKYKNILIIAKSEDIAGVMSPIKWKGGNFDKGYQKIWDENGNLKSDFSMENGKLNGIQKNYWENGKLKNEYDMKNNEPLSYYKSYTEDGKLKLTKKFKYGEEIK